MFHISNSVICVLNLVTLFFSFPLLVVGLWLRSNAASDCEQVLAWPILATGLFLMVVSLLGLLGSCCSVSSFLWLYLVVTFLMLVGLFCFSVFAIVVTNRSVGQAVAGKGYMEYRIGDYSNWLQKRVADGATWSRIKSCMVDGGVCGGLHKLLLFEGVNDFYLQSLSTTQDGCCKPPSSCGYQRVNGSHWEMPEQRMASKAGDCSAWSNDDDKLCFNCDSCKVAVLANIRREWKNLAIFNICLFVFLSLVYSIGCCAFRNSCDDNRYTRYRGYP
ncbi:hypothetical protein HPP92_015511 [Vanilla planifolia]|uniref:Tetraspanin-8 n=1 Tax=Vanilla planifolia TaxID=51239 RepID=A0A835QPN3_VANPL|nr:hypothetical protein HPP92_015511 [Vanilla planifolia]